MADCCSAKNKGLQDKRHHRVEVSTFVIHTSYLSLVGDVFGKWKRAAALYIRHILFLISGTHENRRLSGFEASWRDWCKQGALNADHTAGPYHWHARLQNKMSAVCGGKIKKTHTHRRGLTACMKSAWRGNVRKLLCRQFNRLFCTKHWQALWKNVCWVNQCLCWIQISLMHKKRAAGVRLKNWTPPVTDDSLN